jgi:predicted O-methyltransferase YrrM
VKRVDEINTAHRVAGVTLKDMRRIRRRAYGSLFLRGYFPWKGSSSAAELVYLTDTAKRTNARLVAEIGFNTGLSSHAFLEAHPDVEVVSFDLGATRWVPTAKKLIDRRFPGRHTLILGDSRETVPKFKASNPEVAFDLVFIDGGHAYEIARADLVNMHELASDSTAVIMDDLVPQFAFGAGPTKAWNDAIIEGLVRQEERVRDGRMRGWALGRYVF